MKIQETLPLDRVNDETLSFFGAIGVDYLTVRQPLEMWDGRDRTDEWREVRQRVEAYGLVLYNVATKCWDEIILGMPGRDEKIQAWCGMLRNLGAAGIPTVRFRRAVHDGPYAQIFA